MTSQFAEIALNHKDIESFMAADFGGMTVSDSIYYNNTTELQTPVGSCNSQSNNGNDVGLLSMFLFIAALSNRSFRKQF